ncbi:DsrE/DsrF/DrsH-like family protein [Caldinitratiruptor microaerophilus]|uniref:Peroxiredoxin n=1 Tax=Caldinitratiruptor microaerophilus TaxID=671077 RepID=A0AA35GAT2_9FIRM|nr:DsrE/DsrF/DrsH-like family protein [Caldinitratiruptor microaerophilus]BDG61639.1 peroxiredoxin [Caldinitratiruptor microaerophilus]
MANRLSMIVFSGTVDKLYPVAILASGAVAMGQEVRIFLTFWGLMALKKGAGAQLQVSKDYEAMGAEMARIMQEKKVPSWLDTLRTAKELGDVKVYACGMTMDLFQLKLEDLEDVVDGVAGVGEFIEEARQGEISLFI